MYNYAMMKILEIEVAGQAVATMLKAFATVGIKIMFDLNFWSSHRYSFSYILIGQC